MNTDMKLAEQAAGWVQALKGGGKPDHAAFGSWLKESPKHIEEVLCAAAVDRALDRLEPGRWPDISKFLTNPDATVIPLTEAPTIAVPPKRHSRYWAWGVAAALICAAGTGWMLTFAGWQHYSTAVGEQRTFTLDDGSLAYVNTASRVDVRITKAGREISMREGEALFKVQPDPVRPFVVHSDNAAIQALGTEFNVHKTPRNTVVAVLEGMVEVSAPQGTARLSAGEATRIAGDALLPGSKVDVARASAWRQRRLIFESAPLPEVAEEFNRYNRSPRIRIAGQTQASRRFTGAFDADDPDSLIALLATYEDLKVDRRADEIVITRR